MVILSIIILSYNTKELTVKCLESIVSQYMEQLENGEFEIIVVDNASTDGSPSVISNFQFPISNLKIIENKENVGFAKGCNVGAKAAKGEYVLFLNSDTEVLDRGFLKMVEFLDKNPKIGILGGRLLNPDNSPQPSTGKFYTPFNLFLMLIGGERFGLLRKSPKNIEKVDWVSGGCMMVKKDVFKKLKGFDENFFMYVEDMEICFRAKKLGFLTYFYPNISIFHKKLGSSNRSFAIIHIYKGLLYFYSRHKSRQEYLIAKLMLTVKAKLAIFVGSFRQNSFLRDTYRRALKF